METAEDFFERRYEELGIRHEDEVNGRDVQVAIEFAQMHVTAALEKIANGFIDDLTEWSGNPYTGEGSDYLSIDKIMKVYPMSNIR